ncbi:MAG: GAF domain-containing protein [Mycobacterium sp.]
MKSGFAHPEPSIAAGQDPRTYARLMSAVYDATMAGDRAPARPRPVIWESWRRLMSKGLRPDRRNPPVAASTRVEALRQSSGLAPVIDEVTRGLNSLLANGDTIFAMADADGTVLYRAGSPKVLRNADRLGFIEGAQWSETSVGTNALGTALVSQTAVQTFYAEHYNRNQHPWTCAGAPIRDPRTGKVIGVIDVTGPASTVHPTTIALVDAVARLAESNLREQHDLALNRLRMVAAPILSRISAPALAVDANGWVAAVDSLPVQNRILLPPLIEPGQVWVPALGLCDVETLPGGWLIRQIEHDGEQAVMQVLLDLGDSATPRLGLTGQFGNWQHDISPRLAEILLILAVHTTGRSALELADDLYDDPSRVGAVRVEMSRLRKRFAGLVAARPYRFADSTKVEVRYPQNSADLLPPSVAPAIQAIRDRRCAETWVSSDPQ